MAENTISGAEKGAEVGKKSDGVIDVMFELLDTVEKKADRKAKREKREATPLLNYILYGLNFFFLSLLVYLHVTTGGDWVGYAIGLLWFCIYVFVDVTHRYIYNMLWRLVDDTTEGWTDTTRLNIESVSLLQKSDGIIRNLQEENAMLRSKLEVPKKTTTKKVAKKKAK